MHPIACLPKCQPARPRRRIDLVFGIGYKDDLREAKRVIETVLKDDPRVLADPAPYIGVAELAASSVDIHVRPWVATADYFATMNDLKEKVKLAFDANGITIPYPQMDMHQRIVHVQPKAETAKA